MGAPLLYNPRYAGARLSSGDAQVAQLVEHATENRSVGGSIPPLGTLLNLSRDIFPAARCVLLICFLSTTNTPQLAAGIFYYQTRSGLIALLHRLGMEHRKPKAISRKLDPAKQAAFIKGYEALNDQLSADEAVIFADAVHPTHAARPAGCWAPKEVPVAVEQSSGRDRLNIHGAIDLETGQTIMKDVLTVDALSTIMLLMAIEAMYPGMRLIHVFLDNARYHHAKLV